MLDPPVPLNADWADPFVTAIVTFSHPLLPVAPGDNDNWFVRRLNTQRPVTFVTILGNQVTLLTAGAIANPGDDVISYSPPPFEVVSNTARQIPAPAFADFPLT